jgi:hypothetical protein
MPAVKVTPLSFVWVTVSAPEFRTRAVAGDVPAVGFKRVAAAKDPRRVGKESCDFGIRFGSMVTPQTESRRT